MSNKAVEFIRRLLQNPDETQLPKAVKVKDLESSHRRAYQFLTSKRANTTIGITKDPSESKLWFWWKKKS